MKIFNERKLSDLQQDFKDRFPYLKIEFFQNPHSEGVSSNEQEKLEVNLKIHEIRKEGKSKDWPVEGNLTVGDFERIMSKTFGLNVQVYRKEHGKWLQSWVTDVWTLDEQNNRSKIMGDIDDALENLDE